MSVMLMTHEINIHVLNTYQQSVEHHIIHIYLIIEQIYTH